MNPQDQPSMRRLAGPGELPGPGRSAAAATRTVGRDHGIRQVRRLSNWTAAALVAATAVTAGYFARAGASPTQPAVVTGAHSQAPNTRQPCVTVPVATSGGSGVTTMVPTSSCGTGQNGTGPVVVAANTGDGRED